MSRPPEGDDAAAALAIIARCAQACRDLGVLGAVVAEYLDEKQSDLVARLLGVDNSRGHSVGREAAVKTRNAALRAVGEVGFGQLARSQQAIAVARVHKRYAAGDWIRDRTASTNPHPPGTVKGWLWEAMKAVDRTVGPRQVDRILADDTE
jgi:hypothetical protein